MTPKGSRIPQWFVTLVLGTIGSIGVAMGTYGVNRAAKYEEKVDSMQVKQATEAVIITNLDAGVTKLDGKLDNLDKKMDAKLDKLETKIDRALIERK